ncbi:alpha/beta hydrolase [Xanthobacter sp. AM11]|uniref:alpha/beta hydrolase n=1 Tax=Xanthobacter sp. AM11 TaxID=3380643 RepID=UPI0039BEEF17
MLATFLARGAQHNVRLLGAPSGDHEWLQRLGTSDTYFRSFLIPGDTRLSYRLAPDVPEVAGTARAQRMAILATAQADPFNRAPWPDDAPDAFSQESTLVLSGAPVQPGMGESGAPAGRLSHFPMASARLGNRRAITLYRPAGFDPHDPDLVLLVVFDGPAYLSKVPTPAILDALIAERRLPPVLAVFVSPIDGETRGRELPGNDAFADFLADELMPAIRQMTGAGVPAGRTILAGSSYGGLAAATVALRHPQVFGNALALSGSFWWRAPDAPADGPGHVAELVARTPPAGVRFHLSAGRFETGHMGTAGILDTSRHLRDVLRARGYDVSYGEYAGGHDYLVWRGALADGLLALAPRLPPGERAPR